MRNPFKRQPKVNTGVMEFGSGGTLRLGYGEIPPDEDPAKVSKETIKEVESYLKGGNV